MDATNPASTPLSIVWLRSDLRLADNPALTAAARTGAVLPLFILDDGAARPAGGASRWWLHHSLAELGKALAALGSPLVLRRGSPAEVLGSLAAETGARVLHFNRRYDPDGRRTDAAVRLRLEARGVTVHEYAANLLFEPDAVATGSGGFHRVFTPFWRAVSALPAPRAPLRAPDRIGAPATTTPGDQLDAWGLLPSRPDWASAFGETWRPGESGARDRLAEFIGSGLAHYDAMRDRPDHDATSRLSPHLAFGEISPFTVWDAIGRSDAASAPSVTKFRQELVWREFSYHLLFHFPGLPRANFNASFDAFPWVADDVRLRAWQRGETGYPIVDAGMRQLWRTGWMHNRVRMIVASFLVKHLLIDWRAGEDWFWDTLVDADPANNAASWQWVAGSGADAAPYFRIFNPVLQGEKFDPNGAYVRRYVPEIAALPDRFIHQPWTATEFELAAVGIRLGRTYPGPLVDHGYARERALRAFKDISR
jgi:deoxyribodipyrimidine photo-lyase